MKKIYSTLCLLLFFFGVLQAQPTLYGLTNLPSEFISKFDAGNNTLSAVYTVQANAKNPANNLVKASNGKLYGMTTNGGSGDVGVIFSFDPATGAYAVLKDFDGDNGANPYGGLVQASNGKLYGMTRNGGNNGVGVIFSFDPVTGVYTNLKDLDDATGRRPQGSLVQASNGKLYGMTFSGGTTGSGVIFSFDPATSVYTKLKEFAGTDGANPYGSLVQATNGKLYGVTYSGGSSSYGVIFSFDPAAGTYTKLKDFDGTDGGNAQGSLVQVNGKLYGTTSIGGSSGNGVIFSYDPTAAAYTLLKAFDGTDGKFPQGSLVQVSGKLYGTTYAGGANDIGVVFSFDPANTTYTVLQELDGTNGRNPQGSLVPASNGILYGVAPKGGDGDVGVIFALDIATIPTFDKVKDFASTDGSRPLGSLVKASNGKLYGMTRVGGSNGYGVIFSFDPATSASVTLKDFDGADGKNPQGSLIQASNGKFYGMTQYGGDFNKGVIFSFDPATSVYTKLKDFAGANGESPYGSLVQASNGKLYGMTFSGGSNNVGVIFSFDPVTAAYAKVKDFASTDGANPYGDLMQASNGKLYGMTYAGGNGGYGVIFSFDPSTAAYTKIKDFDYTNGRAPYGSLMQASNGTLYGMTSSGGGNDYGVVFSLDLSGAYTKIHDFDYGNGGRPFGTLMQASNGILYGMTRTGGSLGAGVVFSVDPSSGTYTKRNDFDGFNGAEPYGALVEVGSGTVAATISTGSLNSSYCPGTNVPVNYTATGTYTAGNVFTAQLSDASGSFTSPVNIGTITATASGTINATIPTGTAAGTGYRIRVVASDPVITGMDNGADIAVAALVTFYLDADHDGYGDLKKSIQACSAPDGYLADSTDCDDTNAAVHPGATEVCNGIDDNCDGQIDEGVKTTFYADADRDGYGNNSNTVQGCSAPTGYVMDNTDCDDTKASVHPGATEQCNSIDDDCDGQIDEGVAMITYYRDVDGDGYGNAATSTTACMKPDGYVSDNTDCNDSKASVHPNATEVCGNGIDENCNGQIDENCAGIPNISINDVAVYESDGVAVLTISLDKVSASAVSINYATQGGTAVGSGKGAKAFDFTTASGNVTIAAGNKTAQVRITITKDNIAEVAESFKVNLSLKGKNARSATISKGSGTVTINDGTKPALTSTQSVTKTGTKEVQPFAFDLRAYPNPTTRFFTINLLSSNRKQVISMIVADVNGRVIEKRNNLTAGQTLQIGSQYQPGSYIVTMIQGKASAHVKLVKIVY